MDLCRSTHPEAVGESLKEHITMISATEWRKEGEWEEREEDRRVVVNCYILLGIHLPWMNP